MAARAPIIEVIIRDEVTAQMERLRQRTRSGVESASFKSLKDGFKSIEEGVVKLASTVQREVGALARLTGAGAFLGGGVIAGITKATQALAGMTRAAEQTRYMADQLGLSEEVFKNLTARGKALGMSAEQTKSGLSSLATNLRDLKVLGQDASIYKQLVSAGGESGRRFGDQLIAQVRGPGGIEAGIKQFTTSMAGMLPESQAKIAQMFGAGSVGFRDLFAKELSDLPKILSLPEGEARRLNIAMTRLNIQFDNMKVTLGSAVIPMFEQLTTTISNFLQGPGGKLVKQAADWFASLNIDWKSLGDGFIKVVGYLKDAFIATYNAFLIMDPIVQRMDGWTPILLGLAAAIGLGGAFTGRVGLVGALAGLGAALVLIGRYKDVIPGLAAVGNAANAGTGTGASPGGSGGTSSPLQLPGVTVTPPPRTRMPLPMPRPSSAPGGGDTSIPSTANPISHRSGRSGYYIPGYTEEPDDNEQLRRHVASTRVQVASLANYIGASGAISDDSGAGGLAGFGGPLRRLGAPMGDGPGGRSPRSSRGDDSPGSGREPGSAGDGSPEALAKDRAKFAEEMKDPAVRARMLTLAVQEVGHNPKDIQQFIETIFNRASARRQTLHQAMQIAPGYRGGVPGGQYPNLGNPRAVTPADQKAFDDAVVPGVLGGSDYSNRSTGNASGRVNRSYPTRARSSRDERYVLERDERDIRWHKGIPTVARPDAPKVPQAAPDASGRPIPTRGDYPSPITGTLWQGPGAARSGHTHAGQDIGAPTGTPIYSMGPGVVLRSEFQGGITGGITVIRYDNGLEAKYMHLSNWQVLRPGTRIEAAGQVVALSGATGAKGISPHLHVEYRDRQGRLLRASDVHGYGPQDPRGEGLHGRKTYAGQPGSYAPGEEPPGTEKQRQQKAQEDFDAYLKKQKEKEDAEKASGTRSDLINSKNPIKLTLRVKGPSGVKASVNDSSGIETNIERSIDRNVMRNVA